MHIVLRIVGPGHQLFDSTGPAIPDLAIAKIAVKHGKTVDLPFPKKAIRVIL
jgi:hypothetical protein